MAATRLMPIHVGRKKTIESVIDYVKNPEKTRNGELISSYECDSRTADSEFLLSKNQYQSLTGRNQGSRNVIAYHTRQSFLPGEVTPEEANRIGYELAMSFTKGKHAFIVCTHIDKKHTHNHIIFNSIDLDCTRKFRNFLGSTFALRRVSDRICLEHGLSVIENPKPSRGHYGQWLTSEGIERSVTFQNRLRQAIDIVLENNPDDMSLFIAGMQKLGYEVKNKKHLSFRHPEQIKFTRCDTLKGNHTDAAIRERLYHKRNLSSPQDSQNSFVKINLLIDIQAKIKSGKGPGFERWAKIHNLKQMAKTLIFLQEQGLDQYDELSEKATSSSARFNALSEQIKDKEKQLSDNVSLQKHIINYSKTRSVYVDYRKAGYNKKFRATHEAEILLHQSSKKFFDDLGVQKLPTIASLRNDYATILSEKKKIYRDYTSMRDDMKKILTAKQNVDNFLFHSSQEKKIELKSKSSHRG